MNDVLKEIFESNKVRSDSGEERALYANITLLEGQFLQKLILDIKPKISLEVGMAYGISTMFLCDAMAEVKTEKHYVIDPNQTSKWGSIGMQNVIRAGYGSLVKLREQMSHLALPEMLQEGLQFDFVFVDGWHVYDQVLVDFFFIDKLLKIGSYIVFDDANWPSIRKVLRYIVINRNYEVVDNLSAPTSKKDKLACILQPITKLLLGNLLKPEIIDPDGSLGLLAGSRCIVIRKVAEDNRRSTDHAPF